MASKILAPIFLLVCFAILLRPYLNEKISNNIHNLIIKLTTIENLIDVAVGFHNQNLIHLETQGICGLFVFFYLAFQIIQLGNLDIFFNICSNNRLLTFLRDSILFIK